MRSSLFLFALALAVTGCGGGSVSIHPISPNEGLIPASQLIVRLESVSDEEAEKLLAGIAGPKGDVFDWNGFWEQLAARPSRQDLVRRHRASLLALHAKDCGAYERFARFLVATGDGFEYATGDLRRCPRGLSAPVALDIARAERSKRAAFRFLAAELAKQPDQRWIEATRAAAVTWLATAADALIQEGEVAELLDFATGLASVSGEIPLPQFGQQRIFVEKKILERLFVSRGHGEAIRLLSQIARVGARDAVLPSFSREQLEPLAALALRDPFPTGTPVTRSWASLKALFRAVSRSWPLRDSLDLATRLERRLEVWADSLSETEREQALETATREASGTPLALDFAWLSSRKLDGAHPVVEEARRRLATPLLAAEPTDRVLEARLAVTLAVDAPGRRAAMESFCRVLDAEGVPAETLSPAELAKRIEKGLSAGCYRAAAERAIRIESKAPVQAAHDSLVLVSDAGLVIDAPAIDLGMIWLRTTRRPAPLPLTPTPPSKNAVAFPLLLGLAIPEATPALAKATHFFTLHYVHRAAAPGEADPTTARQGFAGPDLVLKSPAAVAKFPFVSQGGPGQPGAPRRAGGRADFSFVDIEKLSEWLGLQVETTDIGAGLLRPIQVHPQLSLRTLEELLLRAKRGDDGGAALYVIPESVEQLDPRERAKVYETCEALMGRALVEKDVAQCLKEKLAPLAFAELRELVSAARRDGDIDRLAACPRLDGLKRFSLPDGAVGPVNPDGPEGEPGVIDRGEEDEGGAP